MNVHKKVHTEKRHPLRINNVVDDSNSRCASTQITDIAIALDNSSTPPFPSFQTPPRTPHDTYLCISIGLEEEESIYQCKTDITELRKHIRHSWISTPRSLIILVCPVCHAKDLKTDDIWKRQVK